MEASELRIGNYVMTGEYNSCWRIEMFLGTELVNLEVISFEYTDDNHDEDISELKQIPITEEWLLKFGFEKNDSEKLYLEPKIGEVQNVVFYYEGDLVVLRDSYEDIFLSKVEFIHDFQNLYYSLFKEESTIKGK